MPFEEQPARVAAAGHVPLGALCGHLLRRAQQHHTEVWAGVVGPDATGPQYAVLSAVEARPGVDQRTVGALASLDRSTTAQVVRRLETRGWLTRVTDPADRRRDLLGLTSSGAAQLRALHPRASIVQDRLLAPLSARERSAFVRDLAAVARVEDVPGAGHGPDAPWRIPGHLLRRAQQVHTAIFAEMLGGALTGPQYAVLHVLDGRPGVDQGELGARTGLDRSTTADVGARLERRGWVTRERDPDDARRRRLSLTGEGRRALDEHEPRVLALQDVVLAPLPARARPSFRARLARVARLPDA
ncbi:MarR family winged helix-turn-helix transcriptional regulator [Phycicoccus duodecadis]|uniref:DNA-binding MarR family transcriptional regulator n=1 Tax=Phycicoccus duodecadis TaxID=173053 RepID=A0A2N3YF80_9MICO|nr:MarR family winged helix-turn-helix transcriptional regulator [Phycicoccus duodecadis]PKW25499.1 DNA-binding MarR family transcriptional regulator [Phycicoccus duodecadis]